MGDPVSPEDIIAVARINSLMALRRAPKAIKRDAEDVFQEAALGAVKAAAKYRSDGGAAFRTYAGRASFGAAVDSFRRGKYPRDTEQLSAFLPDRASPDNQNDLHRNKILAQALDALAPRQRRLIVLIHFKGITRKQIAIDWGVSSINVSQQYGAAMAALRALLVGRYNLRDLL